MRQLDINNNFSYGVRINIIITVMLDMLLRSSYSPAILLLAPVSTNQRVQNLERLLDGCVVDPLGVAGGPAGPGGGGPGHHLLLALGHGLLLLGGLRLPASLVLRRS